MWFKQFFFFPQVKSFVHGLRTEKGGAGVSLPPPKKLFEVKKNWSQVFFRGWGARVTRVATPRLQLQHTLHPVPPEVRALALISAASCSRQGPCPMQPLQTKVPWFMSVKDFRLSEPEARGTYHHIAPLSLAVRVKNQRRFWQWERKEARKWGHKKALLQSRAAAPLSKTMTNLQTQCPLGSRWRGRR